MADPLADHEHNTLTTLKLCERLKDIAGSLQAVVYASAGLHGGREDLRRRRGDDRGRRRSRCGSTRPYQISKIIGELYGNYYTSRYGLPFVKARFQNVYGPGEVLGAGRWRGTVNTVWRNVTPTFIYRALKHEALPVENGGIATRDFIYVEDMARGLQACALRGGAGEIYNLASGARDLDPRAGRDDQRADRQPDADRARPGARLGPLGPALRRPGQGRARARLPCRGRRCATASSARSRGRARTSTGSRRAWRATPSRWPLPARGSRSPSESRRRGSDRRPGR